MFILDLPYNLIENRTRGNKNGSTRYYTDQSGNIVFIECRMCSEVLTPDRFTAKTSSKTGKIGICKSCRSSHRSNMRRTSGKEKEYNNRTIGKYRNRSSHQILQDQSRLRPLGIKRCRICLKNKQLNQYSKCASRPDGLQGICKTCGYSKSEDIRKNLVDFWESREIPVRCYVCSGPFEHIDHVVPRSLGGADDVSNYLPLCGVHNIRKSNNILSGWVYKQSDIEFPDEVLSRVDTYLSKLV